MRSPTFIRVYFHTTLHSEDAISIIYIPIAEVCNEKIVIGFGSAHHTHMKNQVVLASTRLHMDFLVTSIVFIPCSGVVCK